ncbi:MAG: hypothetical protein ACI9ES_001664, partial [Oceanospirillaceae bacterium]
KLTLVAAANEQRAAPKYEPFKRGFFIVYSK